MALVQAYQTLTSRWVPFAMRWSFSIAIDYYRTLRPYLITSDAAIPAWMGLCPFQADQASSPVPLICLFLNLGSIYTPKALSDRLYLYTDPPRQMLLWHVPVHMRRTRANLISQTIPNIFSLVGFHDASNDGFSRSHIQARLAASSKIRVLRLCLHFPWGFTQFLALDPLHAQFVARALR